MVFRKFLIIALFLGLMPACGPVDDPSPKEDENVIGKKVEAVTDIQYSNDGSLGVMAVFDEVIRKIHQFDLEGMKHLRAIAVKNPNQDHYLLHDSNGKYTVDLTKKHLSIYKQQGSVQHDPVKFLGTPLSTSFRPEQGFLILYDNLLNVSILQLNPDGSVVRSLVLGPILGSDVSIQSGDVIDNGILVLGMSDSTLRRVDLNATLDSGDWVYETFTTSLTNMKWIAPVPGQPNQVMIRASQSISVFDFSIPITVSEIPTTEKFVVYKYSKEQDPHIVLAERSSASIWVENNVINWKSSTDNELSLIYLDGSNLQRRALPREESPMLLSHLDLSSNTWSIIRTSTASSNNYNSINSVRTGRRLSKTAFSHGGALAEDTLPNNTVLKLSKDYVFALFPSELGYAQRISIDTGEVKELKLFNLKHIKK